MVIKSTATASSPVVGTGSALPHGGVRLVCDEPVERRVCEQPNIPPVLLGQVAAVCVEIAQQHHVLHTSTAGGA